MSQQNFVAKVLSIGWQFTASFPPQMVIFAKGTGGISRSNFRLVARMPHVAKDGYLELDFISDMPAMERDALVPVVSAAFFYSGDAIQGVRIYGDSGFIQKGLADEGSDAPDKSIAVQGGPDVFPWLRQGKNTDGGPDAFPWKALEGLGTDDLSPKALLDLPIKDLVDKVVRVRKIGQLVTMDYRPDRINIVLGSDGHSVVEVSLG